MERDQPHPLIGKYTQTKITSQHTHIIPTTTTTTTTQTASTKYTHTLLWTNWIGSHLFLPTWELIMHAFSTTYNVRTMTEVFTG